MASYTNNTNRVTGLATGMDIDSMVENLMSAESSKYERLQKQQTWTSWQQEAYRGVITKLQDFQSKWFGSSTNLRYSSAFNSYTNKVTNSSGVTTNAIKVNSSKSTASCTVEVEKVAVKESFSSTSSLKKGINTSKTAKEIVSSMGESESISLKFEFDGSSKTISISKSDLEEYKKKNPSTIDGTTDTNGSDSSSGTGSDSSTSTNNVTEADEKALVGVLNEKLKTAFGTENFSGTETAKVSVTKGTDDKLSFSTTNGHTLTISNSSSSSGCTKFGITSGDSSTTTETTTLGSALGSKFTDLIKNNNNSGSNDDALTLNLNGKTINITSDDTVETLVQKINDSKAGFSIKFNSLSETFTITADEGGAANGINITDSNTKKFFKDCLNIDVDTKDTSKGYVAGQDAVLTINGVKTTRTSNDIDYNGLNFTITEAAVGQKINISVEQDTDAVFNMVKSFVEDYNSLISDLNSSISETRAKDSTYGYYEPLTDSEKESMSEDEIEKWEKKAKTGLLYNDSYISGILSSFRTSMYSSVKNSDGTSSALYSIGITTSSDYTQNGKLTIDEDKLRAAISNDSESVKNLFTKSESGIADKVHSVLQSTIGTTGSLRNKAGIENTSSASDNLLSKELSELAKRIAAEKERLASRETRYYSLFSSMETAITQQNSQLASLQSLLA